MNHFIISMKINGMFWKVLKLNVMNLQLNGINQLILLIKVIYVASTPHFDRCQQHRLA